jgi:hypothetical protein
MVAMVAELNWAPPDKDKTYNQTLIYRASSKYGTYSLIITLTDIRITNYNDISGTAASWGKIRFFDSTNTVYSAYSNPIQYTSTISDTNYTTPKLVAQYLMNQQMIYAEAVGTGNSALTAFTLAFPRPIADTETVYLAGTALIRNVDYTIDYDKGIINFTAAPGAVAITADYWASNVLLNSQYIKAIKRAEDDINRRIGRSFYQPQRYTEYVDSFDPLDSSWFNYEIGSFMQYANQTHSNTSEFIQSRSIKLEKYPVTALYQVILNAQPTPITAEAVGTGAGVVLQFTLVNHPVVYGTEIIYVAGAQVTNYTIDYTTGIITFAAAPTGAITADYIHCSQGVVLAANQYMLRADQGVILLKTTAAEIQKNLEIVSVTYDYGYFDLPPIVEDLATRMAAVILIQTSAMGSVEPLSIKASNIGVVLGECRALYESIGKKMEITRI